MGDTFPVGPGEGYPSTRTEKLDEEEYFDWVLRQLGAPVIDVELEREHVKDALKEALAVYSRHKPRRVKKRVRGQVDISTAAGSFKAAQVQWIIDFDGDGDFDENVEYFDYIANEGLVKRSFLIKGLPVVDDDGAYIGRYDYRDESELRSLRLK